MFEHFSFFSGNVLESPFHAIIEKINLHNANGFGRSCDVDDKVILLIGAAAVQYILAQWNGLNY